MIRTPDFIIIGAMKCATSTLHEQLARQQGIFMSTPKEPCFFSDEDRWEKGLHWYSALFEAAPVDAMCGESSTHYTKLPTHSQTIARMKRLLPAHVRFIYIMRHPIDRLVSHYIHEWTQRVIDVPLERAIDLHPELIAFSRYAMQLEPYCVAFGEHQILPVFFERLAKYPQTELERICEFIGYGRSPRWHDEVEQQNSSRERMRHSAWRDALITAPLLKHLRRTLVPRAIRERIKDVWRMRERPAISPSMQRRLEEIFDEDLARLSAWFGVDLRCSSFKEVAANTSPQWARTNLSVA